MTGVDRAMIKVYEARIVLIDPLFYAREGLSGAFTPLYLHATALNHALAAVLPVSISGIIDPEVQSYVISDSNRPKDVPRYKNSLVATAFYITPVRALGAIKYLPEWTKGENDKFVNQVKQGEPLKAEILHYLPPETEFEGFLVSQTSMFFPPIIRLGSFRGKARLQLSEVEVVNVIQDEATASHPVDPLVTKVYRGVMVNMFPYPVVDNATIKHGVKIKAANGKAFKIVGMPDDWKLPVLEKVKTSKGGVIV